MNEQEIMLLVCNDYGCREPLDCPVPEEVPCNECPRHNCAWCIHYEECLEEGLMVEERALEQL